MKITFLTFLTLVICLGCNTELPEERLYPNGKTIIKRIKPPEGYNWIIEESGSFGEFLQHIEVEPAGTKILDYQKKPISNQSEHAAVLKKEIGNKDLQQCADAVIRLRADYLWEKNKHDQIEFHFTNGDLYKWNDYKSGIRPILITNSKVEFKKTASPDDSFEGFKKYLDIIFTYAGTISLNKETIKVKENKNIKTGVILVTPGSPGHAVIIIGRAIISDIASGN